MGPVTTSRHRRGLTSCSPASPSTRRAVLDSSATETAPESKELAQRTLANSITNACWNEPDACAMVEAKIRLGVGAPGGNRTPGLQVRSLSLYPTELRARGS